MTTISPRLEKAEAILISKGIQVTRHCLSNGLRNEVFHISVFGESEWELWKTEKIIGSEYEVTLFPNEQEILIR